WPRNACRNTSLDALEASGVFLEGEVRTVGRYATRKHRALIGPTAACHSRDEPTARLQLATEEASSVLSRAIFHRVMDVGTPRHRRGADACCHRVRSVLLAVAASRRSSIQTVVARERALRRCAGRSGICDGKERLEGHDKGQRSWRRWQVLRSERSAPTQKLLL